MRCNELYSEGDHVDWDIAFMSTQKVIEDMKLETMKAALRIRQRHMHSRWTPPQRSWVRLHSHGSVNLRGQATCGGGIRHCEGNCLTAFMGKLGYSTSTAAERILKGIKLSWHMACRKVDI